MLQSQKIISCLLSIAVIFGIMLTITCMAVENNPQEGDGTSQSSEVEDTTSSETGNTEDGSTEDGNTEEESNTEEEEDTEESSEESIDEIVEESSQEEQDSGNDYYYAGDESYPPYTGSRVLKNPNIVEKEEDAKVKTEDKNIKDWSYVARRWIFLPILFTLLSIGGLVGFNVYANKQNGSQKTPKREEEIKGRNRRNFNRPKH